MHTKFSPLGKIFYFVFILPSQSSLFHSNVVNPVRFISSYKKKQTQRQNINRQTINFVPTSSTVLSTESVSKLEESEDFSVNILQFLRSELCSVA